MKIYLLCGVPGSGKSWVANQLLNKFEYVAHDEYIFRDKCFKDIRLCKEMGTDHLLLDCPFDERAFRTELEGQGYDVIPIFIVEAPEVISERYFARVGKRPSKSIITRAKTIMNKVNEWDAFYGTSDEVFKYLKDLEL
jgi:gluconate kinase